MKKKLIATLVAGAVLSAGLIGLTACDTLGGGNNGGHDINKGEEVNADGWKSAITATYEAKNYAVDSYTEVETKITGTMGELTDLNITGVTKGEGKWGFDQATCAYSKIAYKVEVSNVPDELKDEDEYKAREYVEETYFVKDGENYYSAYLDSSLTPEWVVYRALTVKLGDIAYLFEQKLSTTEDGEAKTVIDLYDAFTYSEGVYTATLWESGTEVSVSVSIKGGYVVGVSSEYSHEEGDESFKQSNTTKEIYNFSGYGNTTVTPSDEAKKAVEDFKAS